VSEQAATPPAKKKGGMKKILLIAAGALVLVGGGVAAGIYASGAGLAGSHGPAVDPNAPRLVRIDGHEEEPGHGPKAGEQPDPKVYKASYYVMEQPFTSNMRDSDGFAQISLGVSTFYDSRVLDRVKDNEVAIRSAILMTLADQDAFVIGTPEGKRALQNKLRDTINETLTRATGYGGVNDVYFTNFIIQ